MINCLQFCFNYAFNFNLRRYILLAIEALNVAYIAFDVAQALCDAMSEAATAAFNIAKKFFEAIQEEINGVGWCTLKGVATRVPSFNA